jgi:hypothetical protein
MDSRGTTWREKLARELFGTYPFYFTDFSFVEKLCNAAKELNVSYRTLTKPGLVRSLLTEEAAEKLYKKLFSPSPPSPAEVKP